MSSIVAASAALAGCAGPSTPLGAVWVVQPKQAKRTIASIPDEPTRTHGAPGVTIDFQPTRQVLHGPKPLLFRIEDHEGMPESPRIVVSYDGLDVSRNFFARAAQFRVPGSSNELTVRVPRIQLSPHNEHRIEVRYYPRSGRASWAYFQPPVCRVYDYKSVKHTDHFSPDANLLQMISRLSEEYEVNPALMTALIAQESAFNPRTVSWAKAIGLTQMTPIAEDEVSSWISDYDQWPRFVKIDRLPASAIRMMVLSGQINETNDWRLNSELSIRGGIVYLKHLYSYWSTPEMRKKYDEVQRTKLILASYNSGVKRVNWAIKDYGSNWLKAPELREARFYVNHIFSYCDYFGQANFFEKEALNR